MLHYLELTPMKWIKVNILEPLGVARDAGSG
jgi:hypothetical protein